MDGAIPLNLGEDHKLLSLEPRCDGYVNSLGMWVSGFACPSIGDEPVFCCGSEGSHYCCTSRDQNPYIVRGPALPLLFVTVIGTAITFITLIITALVLCMSSRRVPMTPKTATPMYRVPSPSTGSGIANMYSCSYESLGKAEHRRTPQMLPFTRSDGVFGSGSHLMGPQLSGSHSAMTSGVQTMPRSFGASKEKVSRVSFVESATVDVDIIAPSGKNMSHTLHTTPSHAAQVQRPQVSALGTFPRPTGGHVTALPLSEFLPAQEAGMCRSTKF